VLVSTCSTVKALYSKALERRSQIEQQGGRGVEIVFVWCCSVLGGGMSGLLHGCGR
jgi:CHASE2 domain-containing sensor protein